MNVTPKMIKRAGKAANVEELMQMAAAAGIEVTPEAAQEVFERLAAEPRSEAEEVSIDELDNVAGGCGDDEPTTNRCPNCGSYDTEENYITMAHSGSLSVGFTCHNCGTYTSWV